MSWLEKILPKSKITTPRRHNIPEGVWTKCDGCEQVLYRAEVERNLHVCPKCKTETLINIKYGKVTIIKEPDAKTQSR